MPRGSLTPRTVAPRLETATGQQQHTQIPLPLTPLSRNREIAGGMRWS